MNNFIWTPGSEEKKDLVPLPLEDSMNGQEGTFEFTSGVRDTVVHTIAPESTPETKTKINYDTLSAEHAELIAHGKTSVEIAQWIGDKLNIPSWKAGEFHGERKVLPSPQTPEEIIKLKKFVNSLRTTFGPANQPSENHPEYFLLDAYVQNVLFGQANMIQVNARLDTLNTDWQKMGDDFSAKMQYLIEKVGLNIKGDWSKLTGLRRFPGEFGNSRSLNVSGAIHHNVDAAYGLWLMMNDMSTNEVSHPASARLCFLA